MSKFNNLYQQIIKNYHINELISNTNNSFNIINKQNNKSYFQLYKSLICQNYNIFPVPPLLLKDMVNFVLTHKSLDQKIYQLDTINNDKLLNWKYYKQFKINIQLMLKLNLHSNIIKNFDKFNK